MCPWGCHPYFKWLIQYSSQIYILVWERVRLSPFSSSCCTSRFLDTLPHPWSLTLSWPASPHWPPTMQPPPLAAEPPHIFNHQLSKSSRCPHPHPFTDLVFHLCFPLNITYPISLPSWSWDVTTCHLRYGPLKLHSIANGEFSAGQDSR